MAMAYIPYHKTLCELIQNNKTEEALEAIANGICIYKPEMFNNTPLYHAILHEEKEIATVLIRSYEKDMRIVWTSRKDFCPVLVACGPQQVATIRRMAENSVVDAKKVTNAKGKYPTERVLLYHPKYSELVFVTFNENDASIRNELLENGMLDINYKSHRGQTYLHLLAARGYTENFNRMLQLGVDYTCSDINGDTCLYLAAIGGHTEIGLKLLKLPHHNLKPDPADMKKSLISAASNGGSVKLFDEILNQVVQLEVSHSRKDFWERKATYQITQKMLEQEENLILPSTNIEMVIHLLNLPLPEKFLKLAFSLAIEHNQFQEVRKILNRAIIVIDDPLPPMNYKAVFIAADNCATESFEEIIKEYPEIAFKTNIPVLIETLHRAIYRRCNEIAEKLVDLGISPYAFAESASHPYNAIHLCAFYNNSNFLNTLIARNLDIMVPDKNGEDTCISIAIKQGHFDLEKQIKHYLRFQNNKKGTSQE